jgi:L-cysteine desulfidase
MVGDDRYIIALDEDEKEICALFQQVLLDSEDKSTIRSLREEQAKCFMQVLQEVRFHSILAINTARRWNCRHSKEVLRCCKKTNFSVLLDEYL